MSIDEKAVFLHKQWHGKIETTSKAPVKSREDLSIAYTPGVAAPCRIIAEDKDAAYTYTLKANTVAVVSDGSAVLGLGNIGPGFNLVGPTMNYAALTDFSKFVCSFLMIAGRLELFTVFTLFSRHYWNSNRV